MTMSEGRKRTHRRLSLSRSDLGPIPRTITIGTANAVHVQSEGRRCTLGGVHTSPGGGSGRPEI